jgi:hypothetical protein
MAGLAKHSMGESSYGRARFHDLPTLRLVAGRFELGVGCDDPVVNTEVDVALIDVDDRFWTHLPPLRWRGPRQTTSRPRIGPELGLGCQMSVDQAA